MGFLLKFLLLGSNYIPNLKKKSSNDLDFDNYLQFWFVLAIFWPKNAKIEKHLLLLNFLLLGSIYIPNFRKCHQMFWLPEFSAIFWPKKVKNVKIEKFGSVKNFLFTWKHIYKKIQKIYQTVWILTILFTFYIIELF